MYAENPKQFNEMYRIWKAHTEQEINTIIWMGVFSGNKTGFVRLDHNSLCHSSNFWYLISDFVASANIKVFGHTYLFTRLLLIGLALF